LKVKFFATAREVAGRRSVEVEAATVGEALRRAVEKIGPRLGEYLFQDGQIRDGLAVLLNGRHIAFLGGLEAKVREGDEVTVFPRVVGG